MKTLHVRPLDGTGRDAQPSHPDYGRWCMALFSCAVVVIGFWGASLAWWLLAYHAGAEQYVRSHLPTFQLIHRCLWYAALGFSVMTGLGIGWAGVKIGRWLWRMRDLQGQYLALVIPRPQGSRGVGARTNPEAPYVLWDRLIATLQAVPRQDSPPYFATELWGDASGRVRWGIWLPDHVRPQRDAVRHLIIAERSEARLVDAPDPLDAALDVQPDDPDDDGVRWYARALLTLRARDYYPLLQDGLAHGSVVAALRPSRMVVASGVSLIVMPAPVDWARRVDQLTQRWRWTSRHQRRWDERYRQEIDDISLKAQQAHAWTCLRVHVVARTREAAESECQSIVTSLTTSRRRYKHARQHWQVRLSRIERVEQRGVPAPARCRAPFPPLPRLIAMFPFI